MNSEDSNEIEAMNITDLILPCPFCKNKEVKIIANGKMFFAKRGYSTYFSVSLLHQCQFSDHLYQQRIQITGETLLEAIQIWNTRLLQV